MLHIIDLSVASFLIWLTALGHREKVRPGALRPKLRRIAKRYLYIVDWSVFGQNPTYGLLPMLALRIASTLCKDYGLNWTAGSITFVLGYFVLYKALSSERTINN